MASTVDTVTGTLKTVVDQERIENLPLNGRNPTQLMTLVAGVLPDRSDLTSGATYPGTSAGVVERRARQHDQLHPRRRVEQRPLQQRRRTRCPTRTRCRSSASRPTASAPSTAATSARSSTPSPAPGTNQYPRPRLRLPPPLQVERHQLLHAGRRRRVEAHAVRRHVRRPDREEPDVLLRVVPGHEPGAAPSRRSVASCRPRPCATATSRRIPRALRNPFTGQPFPDNQIPTSLFSPAAVKILNEWLPLPNPAGDDNPLTLRFAAADTGRRSSVAGPRRPHVHQQPPLYGRFWVSRASTPACAPRRQHPQQRVRPDLAEHGRLGQRHLHPDAEPAEQPGGDVQPDEQPDNFQIYPPDYSTLGINVHNDDTPQWFFNVAGYFGINSGDTNTFLRNEIQIVDTLRWTKGRHEIATGDRLQLRPGGHRQQLPRQRPVHVLERRAVHRRCAGRLLPRQVLELRAGDRRIQEHADALPGDLRPGHVPRQPAADAQPRACAGIRSSRTPT